MKNLNRTFIKLGTAFLWRHVYTHIYESNNEKGAEFKRARGGERKGGNDIISKINEKANKYPLPPPTHTRRQFGEVFNIYSLVNTCHLSWVKGHTWCWVNWVEFSTKLCILACFYIPSTWAVKVRGVASLGQLDPVFKIKVEAYTYFSVSTKIWVSIQG